MVPKSILRRGSRVRVTGGLQENGHDNDEDDEEVAPVQLEVQHHQQQQPEEPEHHLMNGESVRGRTGGGELTCSKKNIGEQLQTKTSGSLGSPSAIPRSCSLRSLRRHHCTKGRMNVYIQLFRRSRGTKTKRAEGRLSSLFHSFTPPFV